MDQCVPNNTYPKNEPFGDHVRQYQSIYRFQCGDPHSVAPGSERAVWGRVHRRWFWTPPTRQLAIDVGIHPPNTEILRKLKVKCQRLRLAYRGIWFSVGVYYIIKLCIRWWKGLLGINLMIKKANFRGSTTTTYIWAWHGSKLKTWEPQFKI